MNRLMSTPGGAARRRARCCRHRAAARLAGRLSRPRGADLPGADRRPTIAQTLVADWTLLLGALLVTLKITLLAFALAVVLGVLIAFLFVQSRLHRGEPVPLRDPAAGDADRRDRAADHHLGQGPAAGAGDLRRRWSRCSRSSRTPSLGLRSVDPGLADLFKLNRATRWQTLRRLRIPSALPYFFGGLRISSGLALIGAVVAEFVAGTGGTGAGLAYQILQAGFQLNIPRLFAALLLITLTGIVLFVAMACCRSGRSAAGTKAR